MMNHQTYIPFSDVWGARVVRMYRPDGEAFVCQLICEGREEHTKEGLDIHEAREIIKHWHDVIMLSNYESEVMN